MTTFRRRLTFLALSGALLMPAFAQAERGPSTPDERARVIKIAADARKDPLGVLAANANWFETWITDVPDLTLRPGAVGKWCVKAAKGELRNAVQFQFSASAIAFEIEHNIPDPQKLDDVNAVGLAALEGVLAAYETLLAQDPKNRSPKMDEALVSRDKGELAAFVAAIAAQ